MTTRTEAIEAALKHAVAVEECGDGSPAGWLNEARTALDMEPDEPFGFIQEQLSSWRKHGSETIVKIMRKSYPDLGFEFPLYSAPQPAPSVSDGWKLVPKEIHPLDRSGYGGIIELLANPPSAKEFNDPTDYYADWWKQLLAAAPEVK